MDGGGFRTTTLEALIRGDGWAPIRRALNITGFGTNAWHATRAGEQLVMEHVEASQEELYLVLRGEARFTIGEATLEASTGTLVFVADPALTRSATATVPETTILVIGGEPGAPFVPSPWEANRDVIRLFAESRFEEARALLLTALEEYADQGFLLYNLACAEAQLGRIESGLDYLRRAIASRPELGAVAAHDEDLSALRSAPGFAAVTAVAD